MVKGISRQVIVVKPAEQTLFDQAIFILRDDVPRDGITDDMLMKEAKRAAASGKQRHRFPAGPMWAGAGAAATGLLWLLCALL